MALVGSGSQQGYDSIVGIAKEATFGTHVTATNFICFTSESINRQDEEQMVECMNGTRDYTRRLRGNTNISGSLEAPLNPGEGAVVLLLANALGGTVTSASLTAGAFSHTIEAGRITDGDVPSLSITKRIGDTALYEYDGVRVNQITISAEQGDFAQISCEIAGKSSEASSDSLTTALVDLNPVNFSGVRVYIADTTTGLFTSTSENVVQNVEVTVNNNLVTDASSRRLGSRELDILPGGRREVRVKIGQRFDTTTAIDASRTDTPYAVGVMFDSEQTIASTYNYQLQLTMPRCYYNMPDPSTQEMGVITQEIDFSCIRSTTTSYSIQGVVQNADASY